MKYARVKLPILEEYGKKNPRDLSHLDKGTQELLSHKDEVIRKLKRRVAHLEETRGFFRSEKIVY